MRLVVVQKNWKHFLVVCLVIFVSQTDIMAQNQVPVGQFVDHTVRDDEGEHKYVVFVPVGYRSDKPTPAILFLHGAGERGSDNRLQLTVGLAPFIQARLKTFPFIVVFPQCHLSEGRILDSWDGDRADGQPALFALDDAQKRYNVDAKRVVLTGWSMGGYGVWSLGMAHSSRWSALLPLSGGGDITKVADVKGIPVWAFHGMKDMLVRVNEGRRMVEALKNAGGTAIFTELDGAGHDINAEVYGNDAVIAWMLDPQKASPQLGTTTVKSVEVTKIPFVPAVEISQAVGLRLGNEVLDALSHSIPQTVSPNLLRGQLNDMFDSTVASGRQFSIRFSGLSYSGQLERIAARGFSKDRILVQLGIKNIALTIGGTSVTGARHSAQAGPIAIRIGQRYPVWLNLELSPYISERRLRMKLVSAGFQIPRDNWSVSQPAGVSVQGFGMTEEAVVSGLTNGLYGAKGRIETEVTNIAPRIVEEIEKSLTIPGSDFTESNTGSGVSSFWPLPVYPPRFQSWPEEVSADENGISLVMGLTVASLDPFGPLRPLKRLRQEANLLTQLPADDALHIVVPPKLLEPLTGMYVESDRAQVDLLDIPEPLFQNLANRSNLQEIIPDLAQYGESLQVRSSVRISRPVSIDGPKRDATKEPPKALDLQLPGVQLVVSIKKNVEQKEWEPCAVFQLELSEQLQASLQKPSHEQRIVNVDWLEATKLTGTGRFAEGYEARNKTLNIENYLEKLNVAWAAYFNGLKGTATEASDINVGAAKLRMFDLKWETPTIDITYRLARIKLSNLTEEPFTYQTKAPTGNWGNPLTLKPSDSHEFEIPYPLTYRRNLPSGQEVYTLPVGSHSEFRVPVTGGAPRLFAAKKLANE